MPIVKTDSVVKKFPYTKEGKAAAKKAVLKKYTGKGGPYSATDIRRINQEDMMKPKLDMSKAPGPLKVLGGMAGRVIGGVAGAVKKGAYNTFVAPSVRYNKIQKLQDDKYRSDGKALQSGLAPAKSKILKDIVKKAPVKPMPNQLPLSQRKPKMKVIK